VGGCIAAAATGIDATAEVVTTGGVPIRWNSANGDGNCVGDDMGSSGAVKVAAEKEERVRDVRREMGGGGGLAPRRDVARRLLRCSTEGSSIIKWFPGEASSATSPLAAPLMIVLVSLKKKKNGRTLLCSCCCYCNGLK
jgi:hypothetical protein